MTNHLWQSTVFVLAAGLLTLAFRRNRAAVRYWVWLAASMKFLIPFAVLMSLGSQTPRPAVVEKIAPAAVAVAIVQLVEPVGQPALPVAPQSPHVPWLAIIWACGFAAVVLMRLRGWTRVRAAVRASSPAGIAAAVEVRSTPGLLEPGVVGVFRSTLLLPEGIEEKLTPAQLRAVLAHELCHVRRRDNLTSAIHMFVEAVFWFHPLVWWIGARLVEERERACDEEVLGRGGDPREYADAILNVCKLYVESPLACVAGVTGSDLKKRIEAIMTNRMLVSLTAGKKAALAAACMMAVAVPVAVGVLRAQSAAAPGPKFEVASIKPCAPGSGAAVPPSPGRITESCESLMSLIHSSYVWFANGRTMSLEPVRIVPMEKSPVWIDSDLYTIEAKAESASGQVPGQAMMRGPMMQALLEDRFKLKAHRETRQVPVYALTVGENGLRLQATPKDDCAALDLDRLPALAAPGQAPRPLCGLALPDARGFYMRGGTMRQLSATLSVWVDREVIDKTGIAGMFDIRLDWRGGDLPSRAPAEVTAGFQVGLQRLGLKLEPTLGPAEFLVIDHVERPGDS